jgi:transcriptional/translational regulatory protein YebC/TACO1
MASISFFPGKGVKDKAEYRLGKASVPKSVITRLIKAIGGKSGVALDRIFYQGMARYGAFLEAMEANNLTPDQAVKEFASLLPKKGGKLRLEREAEGVAKILTKKYANLSPKEMVEKFVATANRQEFKDEVIDILKGFEKAFKRNAFGRIKTSHRTGNAKAVKALADFRAQKGQTKK